MEGVKIIVNKKVVGDQHLIAIKIFKPVVIKLHTVIFLRGIMHCI